MAVFSAASSLKYSLARRAAVSRSAMVQGLRHRLHAGKRRTAPQADEISGRVRLVQQAQHLLRLRLRPEAQGPLLGLGADSLLAQQLQHPGQLQGADGFVK